MQATHEDKRLRWFGSSGIRGGLTDVGPDLGLRLGRAIGARYRDVVVGHDARRSGPALTAALVAGLMASGARVTQVGLVPTPALAHLARHHELGVQVTASHNPAPDNGYKLWLPNGAAPGNRILHDLEALIETPPPQRPWTGTGQETLRRHAADTYADAILGTVRAQRGTARPLDGQRVALDCAHGAGSVVTPRVLSALGAETTVLGASPDGRFPDHPSEPSAEHLGRLARLVADGAHLLGIAHDGDADRTVFVAPDGTLIAPERLLAVLAAARGDTKIALPVDASGVVADHLPGAQIVITPVGDIHLSRALDEGRATIGCEPSGTWFFGDWSPTPEGPYAAAAVAAQVAADPTLLQAVRALPAYARATRKVRLPGGATREQARQVVGAGATRLVAALDPRATSDVDGVRLETDDGWLLVRPSGTEPVLRVTAEARGAARADALAGHGERILSELITEAA